MEGLKSIFNEAWKISVDSNEVEKYLMTFQNLLCRVPKWNAALVDEEIKRIIEKSGCNYLEDLITCVHVIQLKVLTCVRVGTRQKKIDISIPKLQDFIHKAYINLASKVYRNAYLFDKHASPLQQQKYNREFEVIVEECILKTIRDSIPTEAIVRAYLDESVEQEEEVIMENAAPEPVLETGVPSAPQKVVEEPPIPTVPTISNVTEEPVITRLTFDDIDHAMNENGKEEKIQAPKDVDRLEEISVARNLQRKLEEESDDDEDRLTILDEPVNIDMGALNMDGSLVEEPITLDFETL
jgi:hypothetical protein